MCLGSGIESRIQEAWGVAVDFASASANVENVELRNASLQLAEEGITALEDHSRKCTRVLLSILQRAASSRSDGMHDAMWMLKTIAEKSSAGKARILDVGGFELVHDSLLAACDNEQFTQEGFWLIFALKGLQGLADLVHRSNASGASHAAIRTAAAWAVFRVMTAKPAVLGVGLQRDLEYLLPVLMEAMGQDTTTMEGLWACCAALDAVVKHGPLLGTLFLERGGASLLVRALSSACSLGHKGEELRTAVVYFMTSLADGNEQAAELLRSEGGMLALAEVFMHGSGLDVDAAVWAIGLLGGFGAVVEIMTKQSAKTLPMIRGGLDALEGSAKRATGDQLMQIPAGLPLLLDLLAQEGDAVSSRGLLAQCNAALGSVLVSLAPHASPGCCRDVDCGVEALLKTLHASLPVEGAALEAPREGFAAAETAAEAIVHIALASQQWRQALRSCEAVKTLVSWLSRAWAPRMYRNIVQSAFAIFGLLSVTEEVSLDQAPAEIAEAGLGAMLGLLEDDFDSDAALVSGDGSDLPRLLNVLVDIVGAHISSPSVLSKACRCVGALSALQTGGTICEAAVASTVLPVLTACRRYPNNHDVVRAACAALRSFFRLAQQHSMSSPDSASHGLAAALQSEDAARCVQQALKVFASSWRAQGLLEDAMAVMVLARGAREVLYRIAEAPPGWPVRLAGLVALFEEARGNLQLLMVADVEVAQAITETCVKVAAEESTYEQGGRVSEVVALLIGLCSQAASRAGA